MLGQAHHFREYTKERYDYAFDRYTNESARLCGVVDKRLGESAYLAGDDYTIADMATFPWLRTPQREGWSFDDYPNLKRWHDEINARPAVQRALQVLSQARRPAMTDERRDILFGTTQYARR
jgi:GST-like protein